jgi:hypothetical protein
LTQDTPFFWRCPFSIHREGAKNDGIEEWKHHFASRWISRILEKSPGLNDAYKSVLEVLALYIPSAPVEEKGYKNMINLPDWVIIRKIIIKFKKSFENGRISLFPACPFFKGDMDDVHNPVKKRAMCTGRPLRSQNVLIHAGIGSIPNPDSTPELLPDSSGKFITSLKNTPD